ncbi:hypothetical protein SAMN05518672_103688 [Chitinophaga sp. CF118]|uniref:DUF5996 family protein n=1 Tax=Chitinophaga sp. CF118 TaxID=1884367 RepID=UPI0008F2DD59|nr:DUF5996 family protein [Chitinophaga sp. CF118]SFD88454.1 hypothetical protein SAMN05518672_103688 [Chitinophaga sp. CF118]
MHNTALKLNQWPVLKYDDWKETLATVHLWTQIVGKIRLRKMPWLNHSWHVTLYVSPLGLSTGSIPYQYGIFQIDFDFIHHQLVIITNTGKKEVLELRPRTVADFYKELFEKLELLDIDVTISTLPSELEVAIPFKDDQIHQSYDGHKMEDYWQALVKIHNIFTSFRARFTGKCSPVHFFWGAFDLAVTRFSGRDAPTHPGEAPNMPAEVMQEAYSKEVSSCGFWPGNEQYPYASFYSYCYPATPAFGEQPVQPVEAYYNQQLGEFLLPYEVVQQADNPEVIILAFLQSTYEAAANTGHWDRHSLECDLSRFEIEYGCFKEA